MTAGGHARPGGSRPLYDVPPTAVKSHRAGMDWGRQSAGPSRVSSGYGPKKAMTLETRSDFWAAVPYASSGNAMKTTL